LRKEKKGIFIFADSFVVGVDSELVQGGIFASLFTRMVSIITYS
jgi:hypothetical protein